MKAMKWSRVLEIVTTAVAVAMVGYHGLVVVYAFHTPFEHQATHLTFAMALTFLSALKARRGKVRQSLVLLGLLLGVGLSAYYRVNSDYVESYLGAGIATGTDVILGLLLVIMVLVATGMAFGPLISILSAAFVLYLRFGYNMPGALGFPQKSWESFVCHLTGQTGVYGTILSISANYIFLFIIFGALLGALGGTTLFVEVGRLAGRGMRGGAAQIAVVGSALVGTCTGSAIANVTITGAVSIPTMKKAGFPPAVAAAFEAAASTGGQIMPPIMGAAAFAIAAVLAIPYVEIIKMAVISSVLYYLAIFIFAELYARRIDVKPSREPINVRGLLTTAPMLVVPLTILMILLFKYYSAMYCIFWTILTLIAMSFIFKETRPSLSKFLGGLRRGAETGAFLGVSCGAIGLIYTTMTASGLGIRLPELVDMWAGNNVFLVLAMVAAAAVILGCGVPTLAAYLITAMLGGPILIKMGIYPPAAHLFIMYFAVSAGLTPPIAVTALVAAKMADAPYIPTCIKSLQIGIFGLILPVFLVFNNAILLKPSSVAQGLSLLALPVGIFPFMAAFAGNYICNLNMWERWVLAVAGLLIFVYICNLNLILLGAGIFIFLLGTIWLLRKRRVQIALTGSASSKAMETS